MGPGRRGRQGRRRAAHDSGRVGPADDAVARLAASTESHTGRRHAKSSARKRHVARPILAGALAVGLGASGFAYAKANDLIGADAAAFVVGNGVVAQTDELARASTVDMTYRAAASVSRNERRTAISATGLRTATELEAKKKQEAAKQAVLAREAAARAARDKERQRVIANAQNDPKSAARLLMADHGWGSDAQYNCLVNLWTGESDWRWSAENASSGAYGIPQSLPGQQDVAVRCRLPHQPADPDQVGPLVHRDVLRQPVQRVVHVAGPLAALVLTHGSSRPYAARGRAPAVARAPGVAWQRAG